MSRSSPVLLLTIDTLRKDRFNRDCFPDTYSTFEQDFAFFDRALSHGNATPLAFPSIISSHPVVGDGSLPDDVPTIAELFGDRPTVGFSNNGHLTSEKGYNQGFDRFHDLVPPDSQSPIDWLKQNETLRNSKVVTGVYRQFRKIWSAINSGGQRSLVDRFPNPKTTADTVNEFVKRQLSGSRNAFVWGHYMDPHKPFHPDQAVDGPEINRSQDEIKYLNSYEHSENPVDDDDMAFLEELYESNIRYLDRELARLFAWLAEEGLYEDSLIIIVGDHGELFGEHGRMFHPMNDDPYDELVKTPLLVKYPDGRYAGETFDHLVQHADILPTIADELDESVDSVSELAYPLTETNPRQVLSKSNVSVRVTEPSGTGFKRRDESTSGVDTLSDQGERLLNEAEFPSVQNTNGTVVGVEEYERREKLKALGYQ